MNMQNRSFFIPMGLAGLLMVLLSSCGSSTTSTPMPALPTFAPATTMATPPSTDPQPDLTPSLVFVTATDFQPESTLSTIFVTATEQTRPPETQTMISENDVAICIPPNGWIRYTVQSGDTLSSLARRTYTTVLEIQQANCRDPYNTILYAKQTVLYLPFIPAPLTTPAAIVKPTAPPPGPPLVDVQPGTGTIPTTYTFKIDNFDSKELVTIGITTKRNPNKPVDSFQVTMDEHGHYDATWTSEIGDPEESYFVFVIGTNWAGTSEQKQAAGEFRVEGSMPPPSAYP